MTVRAIYEDGVFKPAQPVNLPDRTQVDLEATPVETTAKLSPERPEDDAIYNLLSRRYRTGQVDTAARHDEHQP